MLNYEDLRKFIGSNSQKSEFNICSFVDQLVQCLDAQVTLIDNSGFIIYNREKARDKLTKSEGKDFEMANNVIYTKTLYNMVPIWVRGHALGALVVDKQQLTFLERELLELASGIISINMR